MSAQAQPEFLNGQLTVLIRFELGWKLIAQLVRLLHVGNLNRNNGLNLNQNHLSINSEMLSLNTTNLVVRTIMSSINSSPIQIRRINSKLESLG